MYAVLWQAVGILLGGKGQPGLLRAGSVTLLMAW